MITECAMISHYHAGISYHDSFELTPFEKQIVADFIKKEFEREFKLRQAFFGMK